MICAAFCCLAPATTFPSVWRRGAAAVRVLRGTSLRRGGGGAEFVYARALRVRPRRRARGRRARRGARPLPGRLSQPEQWHPLLSPLSLCSNTAGSPQIAISRRRPSHQAPSPRTAIVRTTCALPAAGWALRSVGPPRGAAAARARSRPRLRQRQRPPAAAAGWGPARAPWPAPPAPPPTRRARRGAARRGAACARLPRTSLVRVQARRRCARPRSTARALQPPRAGRRDTEQRAPPPPRRR